MSSVSVEQAIPAETAIRAVDVSKIYKVYRQNSDLLVETFTGKTRHEEHHSLKDVSFEMKKGQCFGIIGSNGAGKSTLLKIIAGTLTPTTGSVSVRGKVSAILELGTGFHPEYSGRDNVFLGGMCLGMTRQQVEQKYDWIVAFAELGNAIDKPFKTYSSGMQARLTFATAISIEPEILIIDEALAAGDSYFVVKCGRRVRELCESGATVLFVSHSTHQVATLCSHAIWLEDGKVREIGDAIDVCRRYDYAIHERLSAGEGKVITGVPPQDEMVALMDEVDPQPVVGNAAHGVMDALSHGPAAEADRAETVSSLNQPAIVTEAEPAIAFPPQPTTVFDILDPLDLQAHSMGVRGQTSAHDVGDIVIQGMEVMHNEIYRRGPSRIKSIRWTDKDGASSVAIRTGDFMRLQVEYVCDRPQDVEGTLGLSLAINRRHDLLSVAMFSTLNPMRDEEMRHYDEANFRTPARSEGVLEAVFPSFELLAGEYLFSIAIAPNVAGTAEFHEYHHMRYLIRVLRTGYPSGSIYHPTVEWHHKPLDAAT